MRSYLTLAAAAFLSICGIAHADTINTYNVNETFAVGSATGTVTLNATTGVFTASNIAFTSALGNATFSGAPTSAADLGTYNKVVFGSGTPGANITFYLPVDSLVGYTGGSVCILTSTTCSLASSNVSLLGAGVDGAVSGSLALASSTTTTPAAVTPEPSSLLLLGTGVLSIGAMLRRRTI